MGVDPEEQVAILQARVHERLAELRALGQDVRVGAGTPESPDPDADLDEPEKPEGEKREIDLTDGIDLTDARLGEARWDEEEDGDGPVREGPDSHPFDTGDLLEDGPRRSRSQRHRADPAASHPGDTGPRLLGERGRHSDDNDHGRLSLPEATDAVISAARELISYERRLPLLLDAAPRRQSLLIARWSGVVTTSVALSLLVAALMSWLPRWWLLPALACAGAGTLLLRLPVHPPGDRHESVRPGSVVVAGGALVTAICATSDMPTPVLLLGIVAMVGGIWHAQQTPARIGALPRRFR